MIARLLAGAVVHEVRTRAAALCVVLAEWCAPEPEAAAAEEDDDETRGWAVPMQRPLTAESRALMRPPPRDDGAPEDDITRAGSLRDRVRAWQT